MRRGALGEIADERRRQIDVEGWAQEHDDEHRAGDLAVAAACYAAPDRVKWVTATEERHGVPVPYAHVLRWPWSREWWKPKDRRRDLIRAGALIVAEIERLDRLSPEEGATVDTPEPCRLCGKLPHLSQTDTQDLAAHEERDKPFCPLGRVEFFAWPEDPGSVVEQWNKAMAA